MYLKAGCSDVHTFRSKDFKIKKSTVVSILKKQFHNEKQLKSILGRQLDQWGGQITKYIKNINIDYKSDSSKEIKGLSKMLPKFKNLESLVFVPSPQLLTLKGLSPLRNLQYVNIEIKQPFLLKSGWDFPRLPNLKRLTLKCVLSSGHDQDSKDFIDPFTNIWKGLVRNKNLKDLDIFLKVNFDKEENQNTKQFYDIFLEYLNRCTLSSYSFKFAHSIDINKFSKFLEKLSFYH